MRYFKSAAAGVAGSLLALLTVIVIEAVRLWVVVSWQLGAGSGGIGAVSSPALPLLIVAVLGFGGGFWWQFRRAVRARKV